MVQNKDPGFDAAYLMANVDDFVSGIQESMENCSNLKSGLRSIAGVDAIEVTAGFTSMMHTWAPASISPSAIPWQSPWAPPVTIAFLPVRSVKFLVIVFLHV